MNMNDISRLSVPVELSSFDTIKKAVFEAAGDTPKTRRALLACDEALTNIVSYSGADRLYFSCHAQGSLLYVVFSDNGTAFDPTAAPLTEKEFDLLDKGGMGISLIRQCAGKADYSRTDGYNNLYLQFPI